MDYYVLILPSVSSEISATNNTGIILSVIAILISVSSLFIESYTNKRNKMFELEAEIIKSVYDVYLIKKLPNARKQIKHNGEKVILTDEILQVLTELMIDSLFYEYKDIKFYNSLKEKVQELEDYIVKSEIIDKSDYLKKFEIKISEDLEAIYRMILNKQLGTGNHKIRLYNFIKKNYLAVFLLLVIVSLLGYILIIR